MGHFIVMMVVFGMIYLLNRSSKKDSATTNPEEYIYEPKSDEDIHSLLKQVGVQIVYEEANLFHFKFQGGLFVFNYHPEINVAHLQFPHFEQFKMEDIIKVEIALNKINLQSLLWTCVIVQDDDPNKEFAGNVSLQYSLCMSGDENENEFQLGNILNNAFSVAREFSNLFEEAKKANPDSLQYLIDLDFDHRMAFVRNRLIVSHGNIIDGEHASSPTSLSGLMNLYDGVDFGIPASLRIMKDDEVAVNVIKNVKEIMEFDFQTYIKKQHDKGGIERASILLVCENADLQVNIQKVDGCTDKSLFYHLSLNKISHVEDYANPSPNGTVKYSIIEIRLTTNNEDYWEAKYMIDDAIDKNKAGKHDEMTNEQRMVLSIIDNGVSHDLYWGKKYYNNKCLYQSLYHFRKVLRAYEGCNWETLKDNVKNLYYEICYYIGFIYMELNMKERAFYFLYNAKRENGLACLTGFANCICNMKDPFAMEFVLHYLQQTKELLEGEHAGDESLLGFYHFLNRRYVFLLVEQSRFEEAENLLNGMIENDIDVEFAKRELEYIGKQRKETKKG